ncbi:MAG: NADH-quinone oxidoreductase subunit H [Bacteroidales bacterium]|nr:NADH-quinone oxidoreductase subunit H [Bacteroidales bacterium]
MAGILLILLAAVFFPGIILRTRSVVSGRKGPGIFQPVKDLFVLFRKGSVFSSTTGIIFRIAPAVSLASVLCAALVLPFGNAGSLISFEGDFIYFSYMIALGKFFAIIGALDTGSSFEGMGANREAFFSMLVEPAFFILMATFAMFTGYTSFSEIFGSFLITDNAHLVIFTVMGIWLFIQTALVETSRVPVDDPKTHLELTMIHEVMILDNSGFDKALIHIVTYLKSAIYGSLIFNVLVPSGMVLWMQLILFIIVQVLFAIVIGLTESFRARNKMNKNPKFILAISAVAWMAFVVALILTHKFIG